MIIYEVRISKDADGKVDIRAMGTMKENVNNEEKEIARKFAIFLDKFMKETYKENISSNTIDSKYLDTGGMYDGFKRN